MSRVSHYSKDRITIEDQQHINPSVVAWFEATWNDGVVTFDGYGNPSMSANQCKLMAKWLMRASKELELKGAERNTRDVESS